MEYFEYILAALYVILLISIVVSTFNKGNLHLKLLKKMYPERLKGVDSVFNPLLSIHIMRFDIDTILWFGFPVYIPNNKVKESFDEEIIALNKKLMKNNTMFFCSFSLMLIWFLLGVIFDF